MSRLDKEFYQAPDFDTLDETLRDYFEDFLKQFDINEELSLFVEQFSEEKEHKLYNKWLSKISAFLNK